MKFSVTSTVSLLALVASASAFAPQQQATVSKTALASSTSDEIWDPLGLYTLGSGEAFDTFPNMFPKQDFLIEAETKHGRMAMLAWTGVWATHEVCVQKQLAEM
jgi:Chlorophyll A-B binding protein